jgi:5-methylcytosine-specific restriction endonuclease McrA
MKKVIQQGGSRLPSELYRKLKSQVLERDSWRCQHCGRGDQLQIHHIISRSQSGPDSEPNLITLCAGCHRSVHAKSASWQTR